MSLLRRTVIVSFLLATLGSAALPASAGALPPSCKIGFPTSSSCGIPNQR